MRISDWSSDVCSSDLLHNEWNFRDDGKGGVLVDFEVELEFKNRLFEMLAGQVFDKALRKMIGAFETRAAELYGAGGSGSRSEERRLGKEWVSPCRSRW